MMSRPVEIKSPFLLHQQLRRLLWSAVWLLLFRTSPRFLFFWRRLLLICFGAQIESTARVYNSTRIWAPWNLVMNERSQLAADVDCYNVALVTLEEEAIVSQYAYLCTAGHDINDPTFPLVTAPIRLDRKAWVAAKAVVCMGVTIGEGGVVALGALAIKSVEPWTIVGGVPARPIGKRKSS
jgi:putative colanic acid biosynthesis acetyltransferase WcaF